MNTHSNMESPFSNPNPNPTPDSSHSQQSKTPLLEVRDLRVFFPVRTARGESRIVKAVDQVSFHIGRAETLGLVGESGSGKSTIGRAILGLTPIESGEILLDGQLLSYRRKSDLRKLRSALQVVFQDPFQSLNPRMTIRQILQEPVQILRGRRAEDKALAEVLDQVKLPQSALDRYPREFSGGQRQRIGIARALMLKPRLIICDEAVSALDVSIQAQIVNLLMDLQRDLGLSLLFITHELSVVQRISQRIIALYCGKIVESGEAAALCQRPIHPYTQGLIAAAPEVGLSAEEREIRKKQRILGESPSPIHPPSGCAFHPRCPKAEAVCQKEVPVLSSLRLNGNEEARKAACHLLDKTDSA